MNFWISIDRINKEKYFEYNVDARLVLKKNYVALSDDGNIYSTCFLEKENSCLGRFGLEENILFILHEKKFKVLLRNFQPIDNAKPYSYFKDDYICYNEEQDHLISTRIWKGLSENCKIFGSHYVGGDFGVPVQNIFLREKWKNLMPLEVRKFL